MRSLGWKHVTRGTATPLWKHHSPGRGAGCLQAAMTVSAGLVWPSCDKCVINNFPLSRRKACGFANCNCYKTIKHTHNTTWNNWPTNPLPLSLSRQGISNLSVRCSLVCHISVGSGGRRPLPLWRKEAAEDTWETSEDPKDIWWQNVVGWGRQNLLQFRKERTVFHQTENKEGCKGNAAMMLHIGQKLFLEVFCLS